MGTLLAKNMTPQAMRAYYETGGRITDIMAITGKSYEAVQNALKGAGTRLVTGGYGR